MRTIKVLKEMHTRMRAPRAGIRHATGDKYDNATINSDLKLILDLRSATRCRAVPDAADRRAQRKRNEHSASGTSFTNVRQCTSSLPPNKLRSPGANLAT